MIMVLRTVPLLGMLTVAILAALLCFWLVTEKPPPDAPESILSGDDLAWRLVQNPTSLLRSGEDWRALSLPARTMWTTWRFGMIASETIPWMNADGMPTAAEMKAGFTELGLPRAAALVDACVPPDPATGRPGTVPASNLKNFQAMRREIAAAQLAYVRLHLHELSQPLK